MWPELIAGAWLVGEYAYHAWTNVDPPQHGTPGYDLGVPKTQTGTPVPLIYGRCRVNAPILAWLGIPGYLDLADVQAYLGTNADIYGEAGIFGGTSATPTGITIYNTDMLFVLGVGTHDHINSLHNIWAGDQKLVNSSLSVNWTTVHPNINHAGSLDALQGSGGAAYAGNIDHIGESNARQAIYLSPNWANTPPEINGGAVEFLNGDPFSQKLVDYTVAEPGAYLTQAGARMAQGGGIGGAGNVPYKQIPGYRSYLSAFLYGMGGAGWLIGADPQVPAYAFEVSSYPANTFVGLANGTRFVGTGQYDMNPIDVAYDLITDYFGKMGYTTAPIDTASWTAAANTLWEEGNGYSRSIEEGQTAADVLLEIMKQIDGIFYEDLAGNLKVKLVRGDFDPTAIFKIDPTNCKDLEDLAFGSWQDITTRIILKFRNRNKDYQEDSVTVQNQVNATGMDNQVVEVQLDYPGVCDPANALAIANRELMVRSKPLAKCRAIVDRSGIRLNPADPVLVNYPKYGISNMVFRIAKSPRGVLSNGWLNFDLIQDPYYIWRNRVVSHPVSIDINSGVGGILSGGSF